MSLTSSLKTALLIAVMGYAVGCATDSATEPDPASAAAAAFLEGEKAYQAMDFEAALAYYTRALELDDTKAEAYLGRGKVFWFAQQFERAVYELDQALELDPDLSWAYYFRGISLLHLRAFENGIADLTNAIASETLPSDFVVKARHFRAIGHMNLNQNEDAIADVSACIDLEPKHPVYRFERAALYESVGRITEAIADYESFLTNTVTAAADADAPLTPAVLERMEHVRQKLATLRQGR